MMNFLYPAFLFGLLALAIPIIIHLFNFQRPKQILFTNVSFLKSVQEVSSSKRNLKHYLILLSRICFIIFLVFLFAQPVLRGKNPGIMKGSKNVLIYLDNSLSMENEVDNEKALDATIKAVHSLTDLFSPNTNYYFLTNDFEGKDQFIRNKEKLEERTTEITYSPVFRTGASILERQISTIKRENIDNCYVFWFSDFQKSTLGDLKSLNLDSAGQYYFVPFQNKKVSNLYIDSAWLAEPLVRANVNNILKVRIMNDGDKDVNNVPVKLFLDSIQTASTNVSIGANGSLTIDFSFSVSDTISKTGFVKLDDQPIRFDNQYSFVLDVGKQVNIYHIYEGAGSSVKKVFSNESLFGLESSAIGQVNYSKIAESDLVILDGISQLSSGLSDILSDFVYKGGSVAIFPGAELNIASYSKLLSGIQLQPVKADTANKTAYELNVPDIRNPFFRDIFEKQEKNLSMPHAYPVISTNPSGFPILKNKMNSSFLSLFNRGNGGKIFLFTSPLTGQFTNFARHSLFVPVMYKIAFTSYASEKPLAYSFQNASIQLKLENPEKNAVYTLTSKDQKFIPGQSLNGNVLTIDLPRDKMKAGFYDLTGKGLSTKLAFNYGHQESIMKFYSKDELKSAFSGKKNVSVFDVKNSEEFKESFKNENIGTPLWKYCLILALISLLSEILLIRFL